MFISRESRWWKERCILFTYIILHCRGWRIFHIIHGAARGVWKVIFTLSYAVRVSWFDQLYLCRLDCRLLPWVHFFLLLLKNFKTKAKSGEQIKNPSFVSLKVISARHWPCNSVHCLQAFLPHWRKIYRRELRKLKQRRKRYVEAFNFKSSIEI